MTFDFKKTFSSELKLVENALRQYLPQTLPPKSRLTTGMKSLWMSMEYSLDTPGKRFRPVLALGTAKALNGPQEAVLPFALAVELIHTYSLIHDDLPCMDDDDLRRDLPTNHKVFGEALALLAGDGLLTESFRLVAQSYKQKPALGIQLIEMLSLAAGPLGMVGGQAIDIKALEGQEKLSPDIIEELHRKKTGGLIRVAMEGAALISGCSEEEQKQFHICGENIGYAFQIADDILDYSEVNPENSGLPALIGLVECRTLLEKVTKDSLLFLSELKGDTQALTDLVQFNSQRAL